jgi:hypothetical protein
MNNNTYIKGSSSRIRMHAFSSLSLAVAISLGLYGGSALAPVHAQATTGAIFGQAPAGDVVTVQNTSGVTRQVAVDSSGHYTVSSLPLGDYTVTVQQGGKTVDSRSNVGLRVGSGTEVSFGAASNAQNLAAVTVQANALPTIDVTGVDSRTVITSQELARLPIARSAEAIALLAPGVVQGSNMFMKNGNGTGLVSFGGSSVTENAYYINGFNTTDPLSGFGGLSLPYGSIDQQEILTGGYDAAYGRSDGGVISQVGKRGTNEWHFGGQIQWTPTNLQSDPRNYYYVNRPTPQDPTKSAGNGDLYNYRKDNKSWTTTADAYVGGPLIKDKLFFFAAVEAERVEGHGGNDLPFGGVSSVESGANDTHARYDNPKWYSKLDWNITDSNILELTGASSKSSFEGTVDTWDPVTHQDTGFNSFANSTKTGQDLYSGKFTSYITDNLTISALYGKMKGTLYSIIPGYDDTYPHITSAGAQNPALNGGSPITNPQVYRTTASPAHVTHNTNLRIDLTYKLGDHTITAGIDNQNIADVDDGTFATGPGFDGISGAGYSWRYYGGDPNTEIASGSKFVDAPGNYPGGDTGYYVSKYIQYANGSVRTSQHAQYIQDSWQVNDRWLVKAGVRNDQFTNFNTVGVPYLRLTSPQLAPRVGFSWDVNGDSSFKVYGNAGRYYLAMPASVALRSAGASVYTQVYYTYTGIDANGVPTGLTPINTYGGPGTPVSVNSEFGNPRDPKTAAATNIKSEYQDEYILGFDKKLGDSWVYGAKATYRDLRNAIDDTGLSQQIADKMVALGYVNQATADGWVNDGTIQGSYLINPGRTNIIDVPKVGGGYYSVPMAWKQDFGFNTTMKRKYYAADFYLEHPFDGKWFGRIDYLYSKSYGNSEGQVRSDIGQTDVSATIDWDYAQVMEYANGDLANDRRHQLKAYGSYQLTPEWMLSGNVQVMSGSPRSCLGLYGATQNNPGLNYGSYYHYCAGLPFAPGKTHNPWSYLLSLGAEYRPEWAHKKLGVNVTVYNVLNKQATLQINPQYGTSIGADSGYPDYLIPGFSQTPRYVRVGITYDY